MNETEFHQLVDSQLERIEAAIDEAGGYRLRNVRQCDDTRV